MSDVDEVWARMQQVYTGFLARDTAAVDAVLDDDVTIWDSNEFALTRGLAALQDLRGRRTSGDGPDVAGLAATDPVIDVWGDTALVRHVLRVELTDGTTQTVRNTSVWRRADGAWRAVHNHEDVAGGGGRP